MSSKIYTWVSSRIFPLKVLRSNAFLCLGLCISSLIHVRWIPSEIHMLGWLSWILAFLPWVPHILPDIFSSRVLERWRIHVYLHSAYPCSRLPLLRVHLLLVSLGLTRFSCIVVPPIIGYGMNVQPDFASILSSVVNDCQWPPGTKSSWGSWPTTPHFVLLGGE